MTFHKTKIDGLYVVELSPQTDDRGHFTRVFDRTLSKGRDSQLTIAQINQSFTAKQGTIRGLHFQRAPKAEDKIVQCLRGRVFDVAVDLRKDSPTFRQWWGEELTADNNRLLFIPKGCAHGFQTLEDDCLLQYFISEFYAPEYAAGVYFNDPTFGITWPLPVTLISSKDRHWPLVK